MSAIPTTPPPAPIMALRSDVLAALLFALFGVDNVVLLHFLGLPPLPTALLAVALPAALAWMVLRASSRFQAIGPAPSRVPVMALVIVLGAALIVFALGGEGRMFFANADWQVRDAVLADMAKQPWPFAYLIHGKAMLLRAPLGMYLLPAMFGRGHELALLAREP